MKKNYSIPTTERHELTLTAHMLAGSTHIEVKGGKLQQNLSDAGALDIDDEGGDNLGKGGSLWEAWD